MRAPRGWGAADCILLALVAAAAAADALIVLWFFGYVRFW